MAHIATLGYISFGELGKMKLNLINAETAPKPVGSYSQALEVSGAKRFLYISGQVPQSIIDEEPIDFESQAKLVWSNVIAQLEVANMSIENLVKVTTYLSSREYRNKNREVREAILGDHLPALTVIVTGLFEEHWLIEIDAVAAA